MEGNRRFVRFQLRQSGKDTYPNHYDITVAGHLSAGETMRDAAREIQEEIGIPISFDELIPLGQIKEEAHGEVNGIPFIDREISDVFGCVCSLPLSSLKLQAEEVAGVYESDLEELLLLFEGEKTEASADGVEASLAGGEQKLTSRTVRLDQFVPREPGYYASLIRALRDCT